MSPRDKWLYDSRMKYEHDRASCISEGYRKGIEHPVPLRAFQVRAGFSLVLVVPALLRGCFPKNPPIIAIFQSG